MELEGNGNGPNIDYGDFIFDESDSEDDESQELLPTTNVSILRRRKRDKENRVIRNLERSHMTDGMFVKRNMGARKWCRLENAKLVANFADPQDIVYDGSDIISETISSFTKLLRDETKLQIWNDFIEKDEIEQRQIISAIECNLNKQRSYREKGIIEQRILTSAEYCCFMKMNRKIRRCILKRQNLKYDLMVEIEKELRDFFTISPSGVYLTNIKSDMKAKRFYIHAVSQYLVLKARSIENDDLLPNKMVEVENGNSYFSPPNTFLAPFVKRMREIY